MTGALLSLRNVHASIGRYRILHGVDMDVPRGQLTMLMGRNGAGKSTTLRTIMGLWRAASGRIAFRDEDISAVQTPEIVRRGIAYVPENMGIFGALSVKENMLLAARKATHADNLDSVRLEWIFGLFPAIRKFWLQPAGTLSGGQKQMLSIARAIIEPRDLILVDEPSKGLAPSIIANLVEALRELKREQTTVLLVEQNMEMATILGDSVAVMDEGRIVHAGPMNELAGDPALQRRLLGLAFGVQP